VFDIGFTPFLAERQLFLSWASYLHCQVHQPELDRL